MKLKKEQYFILLIIIALFIFFMLRVKSNLKFERPSNLTSRVSIEIILKV